MANDTKKKVLFVCLGRAPAPTFVDGCYRLEPFNGPTMVGLQEIFVGARLQRQYFRMSYLGAVFLRNL
jgi:hypothetical protein